MKSLVLLILLSSLCHAGDQPRSFWDWSPDWTEERLHKLILKTGKAVRKQQWKTAIRHGEKALKGCLELTNERDPRCITLMRNNSLAYHRTGQRQQNAEQITRSYQIAYTELGERHYTTTITRDIYYHLLMDQERYEEIIPLVKTFIAIERSMNNDEFKILEWEIMLYAMYKVTEQQEQQEPTLLRMLELTEKLIGADSDDFQRVAITLAETYCAQEKLHDFFTFARQHKLDMRCSR